MGSRYKESLSTKETTEAMLTSCAQAVKVIHQEKRANRPWAIVDVDGGYMLAVMTILFGTYMDGRRRRQ